MHVTTTKCPVVQPFLLVVLPSPSFLLTRNVKANNDSSGEEDDDSENDNDDNDDDDDDDDENLDDDSSLGDWRKFRASLIDGGLPGGVTTSNQDSSISSASSSSMAQKKSVAAQNEALLAQQNKQLAEEYRAGVWAHTIQQVEVGGLLCRMPLEAELYLGGDKNIKNNNKEKNGSYWKEKLNIMLSLEPRSAPATMDNDSTRKQKNDDDDDDNASLQEVDHWFALAERMVARELQAITESGKIQNGILNPNDLGDNERILLDKYMEYKVRAFFRFAYTLEK